MTFEELKEKYGDEKVLVVENRDLESWRTVTDTSTEALMKAISHHGYWRLRCEVETDTSLRQVIPYVVLNCKGKYFVTKRIDGDKRLKGKYSIGVGGHVDLVDYCSGEGVYNIVNAEGTISNCITRELQEETTLDKMFKFEGIDTFIDDSEDVSKVHICYLIVAHIDDYVDIKETDKLEGQWVTKEELGELIKSKQFENWSLIAISKLGLDKVKVKRKKKEKVNGI